MTGTGLTLTVWIAASRLALHSACLIVIAITIAHIMDAVIGHDSERSLADTDPNSGMNQSISISSRSVLAVHAASLCRSIEFKNSMQLQSSDRDRTHAK